MTVCDTEEERGDLPPCSFGVFMLNMEMNSHAFS